jgi:beta-alanine--pyruvate transaminase
MAGPKGAIELFHGYTYSGHPLACAAGPGDARDLPREGLLTRAADLAGYWEEAVHSLKGQLRPGRRGRARRRARAFDVFLDCFNAGLLIRTTGDTIALSPPLNIERQHIDQIVDTLATALKRAA